jgi:hypothetical protein
MKVPNSKFQVPIVEAKTVGSSLFDYGNFFGVWNLEFGTFFS